MIICTYIWVWFQRVSTKGIYLQKYENLQKGDQEVFSICMELQTRRESRLNMTVVCCKAEDYQNSWNSLLQSRKVHDPHTQD